MNVQLCSSAGITPKEVREVSVTQQTGLNAEPSARGCNNKHCIGMEQNVAMQLQVNSLTPQSRDTFWTQVVPQEVKNAFLFYEKPVFITAFINARHLSLS